MIEAEMATEGQQPSELIKKIKQQQTGITKTVCSKIIEGFYKEFGIDKEVDDSLLYHEIDCLSPSVPDGFSEFIICYYYLRTTKDMKTQPMSYNYKDCGYSLGKDLLLDYYYNLSMCEGRYNKKEIHYLVSKCLDLCVPF